MINRLTDSDFNSFLNTQLVAFRGQDVRRREHRLVVVEHALRDAALDFDHLLFGGNMLRDMSGSMD